MPNLPTTTLLRLGLTADLQRKPDFLLPLPTP